MILNLFSMFSLRSCSVFFCLFVIQVFGCYYINKVMLYQNENSATANRSRVSFRLGKTTSICSGSEKFLVLWVPATRPEDTVELLESYPLIQCGYLVLVKLSNHIFEADNTGYYKLFSPQDKLATFCTGGRRNEIDRSRVCTAVISNLRVLGS